MVRGLSFECLRAMVLSLKILNKWHMLNQVKVTMSMSLIKDK